MFDGKVPHWHHYSCFWKRARIASHADIDGFPELRWEDQEKIKKAIETGGPGGGKQRSLGVWLEPCCLLSSCCYGYLIAVSLQQVVSEELLWRLCTPGLGHWQYDPACKINKVKSQVSWQMYCQIFLVTMIGVFCFQFFNINKSCCSMLF